MADHIPSASRNPRSTLVGSFSALINMLVSPRTAFVEIRSGIQLWVPLLAIALYRVCWLYVQYAPGRSVDRVLLNLAAQGLIVAVEYTVLTLPLLLLLWLQDGRFSASAVFALALTAGAVNELGSLVAALVGRVFFGLDADPGEQVLTNLGWLVSVDQSRTSHHVLARMDALELYAVVLVAWGSSFVVSGLSRRQRWATATAIWAGLVFCTTFIKWYVS